MSAMRTLYNGPCTERVNSNLFHFKYNGDRNSMLYVNENLYLESLY